MSHRSPIDTHFSNMERLLAQICISMHVILEHAAGNIIMHVVRRPGDEAMYMYVPLKLSHVFGLSQSEFT